MARAVAMLALLMVMVAACGGTRALSIDDDGTRVSLVAGEEIQVLLEGNATTGFSWELVEYDPAVIVPRGEPFYQVVDTDLVGGGGSWTWTLLAAAAGECDVGFVYHRTWEEQPPQAAFSFTAAVS